MRLMSPMTLTLTKRAPQCSESVWELVVMLPTEVHFAM